MSQENVEAVRRQWRRSTDATAMRSWRCLTPTSRSCRVRAAPGAGRSIAATTAVASYCAAVDEAWEDLSWDVEEFRDGGDWVLALGRIRGRGRGSGAAIDASVGMGRCASARGRSSSFRPTPTGPRPSKPWGCRSRRCRRRTWRSCARAIDAFNRGDIEAVADARSRGRVVACSRDEPNTGALPGSDGSAAVGEFGGTSATPSRDLGGIAAGDRWSPASASGVEAGTAASKSRSAKRRSAGFATARSSNPRVSRPRPRPSKPWACRSSKAHPSRRRLSVPPVRRHRHRFEHTKASERPGRRGHRTPHTAAAHAPPGAEFFAPAKPAGPRRGIRDTTTTNRPASSKPAGNPRPA